MVVTDFDFTLTRHSNKDPGNGVSGGRLCSCHKVLEDCGLLSKEYHATAQALQQKYYKHEIDPALEMDRKVELMIEWVTKAHDALIASGEPFKFCSGIEA